MQRGRPGPHYKLKTPLSDSRQRNPIHKPFDNALTLRYILPLVHHTTDQKIAGKIPCNGAIMRMSVGGGTLEVYAWGIAVTPNERIWISANHASLAVAYDPGGNTAHAPITVPTVGGATGGAPSGAVYNPSDRFVITGTNMPARLIFSGEDGVISAWNTGSSAQVVADRSAAQAVYKGIEIARDGNKLMLYATNFRGSTVDVFDDNFNFVTDQLFKDPGIPSDFGPFNIRLIDD